MRHLKMLGLVVIAAIGLMAFAGAGTASATAVCTSTTTPECTGADMYGLGTSLHLSLVPGTSLKTTDTSGNVIATCNLSTILADQENTGSATETVKYSVTKVTWEGCSQTTDTIALGTLEIHWISGTHNGTGTYKGSEWTDMLFGVSCTYGTGTGTTIGTLTGGAAPTLNVETALNKTAGGFLCPSTIIWEATYLVTEPHAFFVTEK